MLVWFSVDARVWAHKWFDLAAMGELYPTERVKNAEFYCQPRRITYDALTGGRTGENVIQTILQWLEVYSFIPTTIDVRRCSLS